MVAGKIYFSPHQNEIARAAAPIRSDYARFWMHNGMVLSEGRKCQNPAIYMVQDVLQDFPGVLRLALLQTHYRQPLNFPMKNVAKRYKALPTIQRIVTRKRKSPNKT